jgi:hypothetical protein
LLAAACFPNAIAIAIAVKQKKDRKAAMTFTSISDVSPG